MDVVELVKLASNVAAIAVTALFLKYLAGKDKADREESSKRRDHVATIANQSREAILQSAQALGQNTVVLSRAEEALRRTESSPSAVPK